MDQTTQERPVEALLKVPEAAKLLSVSERTLWQLTKDGDLPHVPIGRSVRYDIDDLRQFIQQRKKRGTNGQRVDES